MSDAARAPATIGVFDSGVGGLSVLHAIRRHLPAARLLYVADSAHAPYGDRSVGEIRRRSEAIAAFLSTAGADLLVVACNTATATAVQRLRALFPLPVVGIEPAVKPALRQGRGRVGVLATTATLASSRFAELVHRYGGRRRLLCRACPGLVEQVEQGDLTGPRTRRLLRHHLRPLLRHGVETLVLGCTHYPFLRPLIEEIAGPGVAIVDPALAVARQVARRAREQGLLLDGTGMGDVSFWSSDDPEATGPLISRLWGGEVVVQALPPSLAIPGSSRIPSRRSTARGVTSSPSTDSSSQGES